MSQLLELIKNRDNLHYSGARGTMTEAMAIRLGTGMVYDSLYHKEYTAVLAGVVEHMLNEAPLPFSRRTRFLIVHSLPFASSRAPHRLHPFHSPPETVLHSSSA
nr:hypothetical protein CDL12_16104 [Ipomoea batatas]